MADAPNKPTAALKWLRVRDRLFYKLTKKDPPPEPKADGFFKVLPAGSIVFYDLQRQAQACRVNNRDGARFFVAAHTIADGRTRYMYGTNVLTERFLGIEGMRYSETRDLAKTIQPTEQP